MIRLRLGTNTTQKTVVVEGTQPITEILQEHSVNMDSTVLHLNGRFLTPDEVHASLFDNGVADETEALLIAVVKATSN